MGKDSPRAKPPAGTRNPEALVAQVLRRSGHLLNPAATNAERRAETAAQRLGAQPSEWEPADG